MYSYEIETLIKKFDKNNIFKGVYSSNNIPTLHAKKDSAYVINLSPVNSPGSHWVGIFIKYKQKKKHCILF